MEHEILQVVTLLITSGTTIAVAWIKIRGNGRSNGQNGKR